MVAWHVVIGSALLRPLYRKRTIAFSILWIGSKAGREGDYFLLVITILVFFFLLQSGGMRIRYPVYAASHSLPYFGTTPLAEIQSACVSCCVCAFVCCIIIFMHAARSPLLFPPFFFFSIILVFLSLGVEARKAER